MYRALTGNAEGPGDKGVAAMRHWPESLLAVLLLAASWGVASSVPGGLVVKLALVVAGWAAAFAAWAGVLWVACRLYDRRESGRAGPHAAPDTGPGRR